MTRKLGVFGERFCLACAVLFCGMIVLQSLGVSLGLLGVVTLAGGLCAVAVLWLTGRYWNLGECGTTVAVFLIRFVLAMAVILLVDAQPVQDFERMYAAAQELSQGGRDYLNDLYYYKWAYQTGFVVYESLILKLFGTGQFPLQVMNALWLGGIGVLVSKIAHCLLPRKAAAGVSVLYALYPAPYFLAAVLTNQHIAAFFLYLAVWLLVRRERFSLPAALLVGVCIAVGNVMRPIGVILILALVCWRGIALLQRGWQDWKGEVLHLGGTLAGYVLVMSLATSLIVWTGVNPEGLGNNLSMWKFAVGLNHESSGSWNQSDYQTYQLDPVEGVDPTDRELVRERLEQANEAMAREVGNRLAEGPAALGKLAVRKSGVMWGDLEYMFWGFGHLDGQAKIGPLTVDQYTQILARGDKGVYLAAFALAMVGLVGLLRRGTKGKAELLLAFLLCGYYAVHLIVEVQARYRYFLLPTVFLLAGYGLAALEQKQLKR